MMQALSTLRSALAGLALAVASVGGAQAATVDVTVDNTIYTLGLSQVGPFTSLLPQLEDQPWWGDASLATQLSAALGDDLGRPNSAFIGPQPWFAFGTQTINGIFAIEVVVNGGSPRVAAGGVKQYAIAESVAPIPVPPAAALMLAGLGALGLVKRRRCCSAPPSTG